MPSPLIWIGVSAITLFAGVKYSNGNRLDESVGYLPGETDKKVDAVNGAIVTCGVYGLFEHTGIGVDENI